MIKKLVVLFVVALGLALPARVYAQTPTFWPPQTSGPIVFLGGGVTATRSDQPIERYATKPALETLPTIFGEVWLGRLQQEGAPELIVGGGVVTDGTVRVDLGIGGDVDLDMMGASLRAVYLVGHQHAAGGEGAIDFLRFRVSVGWMAPLGATPNMSKGLTIGVSYRFPLTK
jgi:hypothetical protein